MASYAQAWRGRTHTALSFDPHRSGSDRTPGGRRRVGIVTVPPCGGWVQLRCLSHDVAWQQVGACVAFMRANRTHPFRDSILPPNLLSSVLPLCAPPVFDE